MKQTTALIFVTAIGVAVFGCDVEEQEPAPPPAAEQEAAPTMPDEEATVTIRVDSLDGMGPYITDGEGRALYAIEGEPEGESTCYDACADVWPPLLASGGQVAPGAAGLQADQIATLQRRDGSQQVTFAGHALYYYQDDQGPGDTEGHDVTDRWGEWYLVRPDGRILEGHENGES